MLHGITDPFHFSDEEEDTESMQAAQVQLDFQRLDEMGKNTYTDESACHTLLEELDGLLVECQNEPELLWRKSRVLCHLGSLNDSDKDKKMEFTDQGEKFLKGFGGTDCFTSYSKSQYLHPRL